MILDRPGHREKKEEHLSMMLFFCFYREFSFLFTSKEIQSAKISDQGVYLHIIILVPRFLQTRPRKLETDENVFS